MGDTIKLKRSQALALLYCEKHATKETTAEELTKMYLESYELIEQTLDASTDYKPMIEVLQ